MKRAEKGTPGYLDYKKKVEIIRTAIYFGIVAAVFFPRIFPDRDKAEPAYRGGDPGLSPGGQGSRGRDRKISVPLHRAGYGRGDRR